MPTKSELNKRLLWRELGDKSYYSSIRGLYGDKAFIDDLDIVNELGGHTECVNALSWSTSGKLLASGSDDQHLNLYSYQPEGSNVPFTLNTTLMTGHSANIFSVKFMPHSNDRTIVSCAGDSQVRVFDVEYSGRASNAPDISARSRRYNTFFNGVRYLNDGNTNTRVYRSHADRAKRIVTESSPHLFLTCSEDGEVRQWDLRQPSSAYPSPRGGQGFMSYRPGRHHDDSNVPPPLISYKRHHVDLNTISCAASQPHYIALGGAHLHCFLHDRRMMGRDLLAERGQMESPSSSTHDDEAMARATQCVRRFAPDGKKRMRRSDNGHITACKISNARPNEMIVSWSGDHIYSFDLISSPDARDSTEQGAQTAEEGSGSGRAKKIKTRKRKRDRAGASATSTTRANRLQSRRRPEGTNAERDMSFRVRYGNGNAEDIPFDALVERGDFSDTPEDVMERARESVMNDAQRLSLRIAKGLVEIRKLLFSFEASVRETAENEPTSDPTPFTPSFTSVLGQAATCLPEMDEVIRTWRYPLNPTRGDVLFQQALRRNRESSRRFVQASGTLARVLGGHLHTASEGESPQLELFRQIVPAPTENGIICPKAQFGYDFLKAILLWLEHGRQGMASGFTKTHVRRHDADRYPIPEGADENAIETYLIPYLQELAGDEPIVNVDASRFERDATRILFDSQPAGVRAFSEAIKIPLEDIGDAAAAFTDHSNVAEAAERGLQALDRRAAVNFWGLKVGRGLLMDAGEGVNFEFVNRAFGGLRTVVEEDGEDGDDGRERLQEDIDPNEEEEPISEVQLVGGPSRSERTHVESTTGEQGASDEDEASRNEDESEDSDNDADEHEDEEDEEDDEEDQDTDESDEEESGHPGVFLGRGPKRRETVESHVPCSSHMKVYQGHCNVKTVKDVNYYGLDDEYVVSGSDCGNFFIWDRKTSKLVNILSGDSDVVNVVQGHPYEPTLAVSGIDSTVKIFSTDMRAQHNARFGINIADPDAQANTASGNPLGTSQEENRDLGLRSRKRMQDSYQITSQNDVNRQGGMNDAFLTRSMLAQVATTLRERQALRVGFNSEGEVEGGTIVLDENCSVM